MSEAPIETQAEEVAKIARGLTGQMRNALTWPKAEAVIPCTLWASTLAGLDRRSLISRRTYSMTPLGKAVRAHLLRTQPRNEEMSDGDAVGIRINGQSATAADVVAIGRAMDSSDGAYPTPPVIAPGEEREAAWRDGWAQCKASLTDNEAYCLTEDVEQDAWLDSVTRRSALAQLRRPDERVERSAFEVWWRAWCPDRELPSSASHIFDAWLARARTVLAIATPRQPDQRVEREGWRPASERPPERVPVLAEYHEWNKPENPTAYHVVWWCGSAYRPYPQMVGESYVDRWNADLRAALATPTDDGER